MSEMALAIAKGFRWQELLDNGTYPTVRALAKAVKQDTAYAARTIRLTLLAPEIIEAVIAGQCPPGLTLKRLSREFPIAWDGQRRELGVAPSTVNKASESCIISISYDRSSTPYSNNSSPSPVAG